ncbi:hypothetical protein BO94DRAFT_534073 [Aspergillus sclerotioniger CBS 115572]|uniref:Uncharacterized protein n=1 Tax=Aspergillus sclerotioniger CBS 115572 TaxID=1450535 RepID=A0A317WW30_9EURO|nr:hypothetical protein BO94DRAFT_534073 [Aspergillus sclerotioniger CBS 115572]PWY90569.1 hypothetical protein BO94DRAFT_534073 [Aspergillus sclerotioniger CBS 115572]
MPCGLSNSQSLIIADNASNNYDAYQRRGTLLWSPRPDQPQLCPPPPGICHAFLDARSNDRLPAPFLVSAVASSDLFLLVVCS